MSLERVDLFDFKFLNATIPPLIGEFPQQVQLEQYISMDIILHVITLNYGGVCS